MNRIWTLNQIFKILTRKCAAPQAVSSLAPVGSKRAADSLDANSATKKSSTAALVAETQYGAQFHESVRHCGR